MPKGKSELYRKKEERQLSCAQHKRHAWALDGLDLAGHTYVDIGPNPPNQGQESNDEKIYQAPNAFVSQAIAACCI